MSVSFRVPLSTSFGRRPVYIVSTTICLASSIWKARAKSYNSFYGACVLNGIAGGPGEVCLLALAVPKRLSEALLDSSTQRDCRYHVSSYTRNAQYSVLPLLLRGTHGAMIPFSSCRDELILFSDWTYRSWPYGTVYWLEEFLVAQCCDAGYNACNSCIRLAGD